MNQKPKKPGRGGLFSAWHLVAYIVIAGLLAYAVDSQFSHFRSGISVLAEANLLLALAGLALTASTFCIAAGIYRTLALSHLRYLRTLAVEIAAAFVNRLLPAGIGGLGLHGDYLHRQKHSVAEATAVVSVNNALGIVGNIILLVIMLAVWPHRLSVSAFNFSPGKALIVGVVVAALAIVIIAVRRVRVELASFARNFGRSLRTYLRCPGKLLVALALATTLTLVYALILYVSSRAVGVKLAYSSVFVVFSVGTLIGAATPTPGGLVGVEAGLFAGFAAYGVPAAPALAAVLLYRVLTYWLPLIPGLVALILVRRAHLV